MIPREFERTYSVGTKINKIDLEKLKIVCQPNNFSMSEFIFYLIKANLRKNDGYISQVIEEKFDGQISKLIEKEVIPFGDDLP